MIKIYKPNRDNLNTSLSIGLPIIALAFIDFFGNKIDKSMIIKL